MIPNKKTPGTYVEELNAFSNTAVEVATAIPGFVGYTPQAAYEEESYLKKPVMVTSLQDFQTLFGYPLDPATVEPTKKQYAPNFAVTAVETAPAKGRSYALGDAHYTIQPDQSTLYYMYSMVYQYFQNGGSVAYIVSIGTYGPPTKDILAPGHQPVNPNVRLADLLEGLQLLKPISDVTMYVVPESTLLPEADYYALMQEALKQANELMTCMLILDIIGGWDPDPVSWPESITKFREGTGNVGLKWGTSYWPYLITQTLPKGVFDYTNINGGDTRTLGPILSPQGSNPTVDAILAGIESDKDMSVREYNAALVQASPAYNTILETIWQLANITPPSGTMAGVWALTDASWGVFKAPADMAPMGVGGLTINISGNEQEDLNVDASTGKSVNAIRSFLNDGILVWGARTLDGNSQDWRYINVRRTATMIEQSLKVALQSYAFQPNDSRTWSGVNAMANNFLTNQWKVGALQGSSAADSFSVACGLGTTMTSQDILEGYLRLLIKIAVVHPAEFIVITLEQVLSDA